MRLARALLLVLLLVLLAPIAGITGAASAAAAEESTLTINGKPDRGVFHDDLGPRSAPDVVRHRGRLTADGAPVAGADVTLERKLVGGDWERLAETAVTDEDGRYEFFSRIAGNARYRASFAGDPLNPAAVSPLDRLRAMRDFNAVVRKKNGVPFFKGNLNPGWNNKVVRWERKKCASCAWKTVDQEKSGDKGTWSFRGAYPPVNKKWRFRASIDGTEQFVKSYSAMLVTSTTPARRPVARAVSR